MSNKKYFDFGRYSYKSKYELELPTLFDAKSYDDIFSNLAEQKYDFAVKLWRRKPWSVVKCTLTNLILIRHDNRPNDTQTILEKDAPKSVKNRLAFFTLAHKLGEL